MKNKLNNEQKHVNKCDIKRNHVVRNALIALGFTIMLGLGLNSTADAITSNNADAVKSAVEAAGLSFLWSTSLGLSLATDVVKGKTQKLVEQNESNKTVEKEM